MYVGCAVEDEASTTTEPSVDPQQYHSRGQGMGTGHGQDTGSGLGQGGPSRHPVGLPDDVGESDGML